MRGSLRNRLAVVFFAITALAIGALYVYVAPGLQSRLIDEKLKELASTARRDSSHISATVGSRDPLSVVRSRVNAAGLASGDRLILLLVTHTPGGAQLSLQADSSNLAAVSPPALGVANR